MHPLALETQPDLHQLGLMAQVKHVENLIIDAALSGSQERAYRAFLQHPLVGSEQIAGKLVEGYRAALPSIARVLDKP